VQQTAILGSVLKQKNNASMNNRVFPVLLSSTSYKVSLPKDFFAHIPIISASCLRIPVGQVFLPVTINVQNKSHIDE
jgi:hypothetical protein